MTLITITLTGEEQDLILGIAGEEGFSFDPSAIQSIAGKIRRVQAAEEVFGEAYGPGPAECGLCGVPREHHDAEDHGWQWLPGIRKLPVTEVRETYVTRTGKVLTDAGLQQYADEAEAGYDVSKLKAKETRRPYPDEFPGEPAG